MKRHPKTYENVFSTDREGGKNNLNINDVSTSELELNDYILLFRNHLNDSYLQLFDNCVKASWLRRKFKYQGRGFRLPIYRNSKNLHIVFVKFLRRNIGKDLQIITKSMLFRKLERFYFDQFFPRFMEENPFENPNYYKFPYKNISVDFLTVVYQMDDRFGLLEEAEKDNMSYAVFLDFVINHIYTENEILGRLKYDFIQGKDTYNTLYVKDFDKDKELIPRFSKKRK